MNLVASDGEVWKKHRRILGPAFNSDLFVSLFGGLVWLISTTGIGLSGTEHSRLTGKCLKQRNGRAKIVQKFYRFSL